jgi:hypothetical protein
MAGLPIDHAFRNLARRPLRTLLTALASALVTALLVGTSSFVRGLDRGFTDAAESDTAIGRRFRCRCRTSSPRGFAASSTSTASP